MRRLLLSSFLFLAACGDKADTTQTSHSAFSPNAVNSTVTQEIKVQLSKEAEEKLLQSLVDKGVPVENRAKELEELKRKYTDLLQRLGEYDKTDELAQQALIELNKGNLEQAEVLLQQAYDMDVRLSKQRIAKRAFDLAEVAELRFEHGKALTKYQEVTQLQPDNADAWRRIAEINTVLGHNEQALNAWRTMQQAAQTQQQTHKLAIALVGEADILKAQGESQIAAESYLKAYEIFKK